MLIYEIHIKPKIQTKQEKQLQATKMRRRKTKIRTRILWEMYRVQEEKEKRMACTAIRRNQK